MRPRGKEEAEKEEKRVRWNHSQTEQKRVNRVKDFLNMSSLGFLFCMRLLSSPKGNAYGSKGDVKNSAMILAGPDCSVGIHNSMRFCALVMAVGSYGPPHHISPVLSAASFISSNGPSPRCQSKHTLQSGLPIQSSIYGLYCHQSHHQHLTHPQDPISYY